MSHATITTARDAHQYWTGSDAVTLDALANELPEETHQACADNIDALDLVSDLIALANASEKLAKVARAIEGRVVEALTERYWERRQGN